MTNCCWHWVSSNLFMKRVGGLFTYKNSRYYCRVNYLSEKSKLSLSNSFLSLTNSNTSNYNTKARMSAFRQADFQVQELILPLSDSEAEVNPTGNVKNLPELEKALTLCSNCLLDGGVIAVPTDTIYGIAGLSQKLDAVNRLYDIKQRNYEKPVAISVGDVDDIYRWSKVTVPRGLLVELLPGPVTVVFERNTELNPSLNPQTSKIGIRIPGNTFMQQLARRCGSPIALTSANISGGRSCLAIKEFEYLWPQLDLIVNGGVLNDTEESRLGSTVVDLSKQGVFRIIRNGSALAATVKVLQDKYGLRNTSSAQQSDR